MAEGFSVKFASGGLPCLPCLDALPENMSRIANTVTRQPAGDGLSYRVRVALHKREKHELDPHASGYL